MFAEDLKGKREKLNLSISEASKKLGISEEIYIKWETGQEEPERLSMIGALTVLISTDYGLI